MNTPLHDYARLLAERPEALGRDDRLAAVLSAVLIASDRDDAEGFAMVIASATGRLYADQAALRDDVDSFVYEVMTRRGLE